MVPRRMKDAALGMGCTRAQVDLAVVLPTGLPGILTGVMLAVARVAGESAPLLFTALFSNYWLSSLTRADGVAGDPDLQLLGHAVREPDRAGLGGLACAGADRACLQHPRPHCRPPQGLTQDISDECNFCRRARNANAGRRRGRRPRDAAPDIAINCKIDTLYYGDFLAVRDSQVPIEAGQDHRLHRPFGLRQEHGAAQPEPDERPDPRLPAERDTCTSSARTSTPSRSIRWSCGGISAWCSSSRTRSR